MFNKRLYFLSFAFFLIACCFTTNVLAQDNAYVCPPCGCSEDGETFDEAGSCTTCGMALVDKSTVRDDLTKVAILIFDGVQIIDYTAPYEVFGQAHFNVFTVAEKTEAITTAMGMSVNPAHSFADHPEPDILLVPGGDVHGVLDSPGTIQWIQQNAEKADYVLSVCNGALILAKTGLLDGLSATTFYGLLGELERMAPNTKVVNNKRFVDNGKVITSAGLSAGVDASLHLVSKILGKGQAQNIALHIEYRWLPEVEFARANFADYKYLRDFSPLDDDFDATLEHTGGSEDYWKVVWRFRTELTIKQLAQTIHEKIEAEGKWTRQDNEASNGVAKSLWGFSGENDELWLGKLRIQPTENAENEFELTLEIERTKT